METDRHPDPDPAEAAAALEHVHDGRLAASRRITTPWWYHPLVGGTIAVSIGSGSLPDPAHLVVLAASVAALLWLFSLYRRLTGLWINALDVPGTRRATQVAITVTLVVFGVANLAEHVLDLRGALVVAGAVLGAAYTAYWRWVERRLVRLWQAA